MGESTEYTKGYKAGYEACRKEFTNNPLAFLGLLPQIAKENKARVDSLPEGKEKTVLLSALRGEISSTELMKIIRK